MGGGRWAVGCNKAQYVIWWQGPRQTGRILPVELQFELQLQHKQSPCADLKTKDVCTQNADGTTDRDLPRPLAGSLADAPHSIIDDPTELFWFGLPSIDGA